MQISPQQPVGDGQLWFTRMLCPSMQSETPGDRVVRHQRVLLSCADGVGKGALDLVKNLLPLKNRNGRVDFGLPSGLMEQNETLDRTRLPGICDLPAAFILEQLARPMRASGFPFSHAETGHGTYASSGCAVGDVRLFMVLANCDGELLQDRTYELSVRASRQLAGDSQSSPNHPLEPTDEDVSVWKRFVSNLNAELGQILGQVKIAAF